MGCEGEQNRAVLAEVLKDEPGAGEAIGTADIDLQTWCADGCARCERVPISALAGRGVEWGGGPRQLSISNA